MQIEMGKKYKTRDNEPVRVLCVDSGNSDFPVVCITPKGNVEIYTEEGFYYTSCCENGKNLVEDLPYADFKVDDKVMVRNPSGGFTWVKRHFAGVSVSGAPLAFGEGCTSFTHSVIMTWGECRKPTQEELNSEHSIHEVAA